jgi:hypothetical protein
MFGSFDKIGNGHYPVTIPQSTHVENTSQYEGNDNAPAGYYRASRRKKEDEKKKKHTPDKNHKIDLVA